MTTLIVLGSVFADVVASLLTARFWFHRLRVWRSLPYNQGAYGSYGRTMSDPAWLAWMAIAVTALCVFGFWPLMLSVLLVMAKPPKTPAELASEAKAQKVRIAELERELGVTS